MIWELKKLIQDYIIENVCNTIKHDLIHDLS